MQHITVSQLKLWLDDGETKPVILDVREPWEVGVCKLDGATFIPMRQIPGRLSELDRDKDLVVLCHHGVRSQQVAYFLEQQGFEKIFNVRGGIAAWANEVDPNMPKY